MSGRSSARLSTSSLPGNYGAAEHAERALNRRILKSEVFDTYAVCSALLTGFCVCTITIEHHVIENKREADPLRYWALTLHQILVRTSTAMTLFSTLVFMLSAMYAKTALSSEAYGLQLYDDFTGRTAKARWVGFWCMYWACVLYMLSIAFGCFYSLHGKVAIAASILVLCGLVVMIWYSADILGAARVMFRSPDEMKKAYGKDELEALEASDTSVADETPRQDKDS